MFAGVLSCIVNCASVMSREKATTVVCALFCLYTVAVIISEKYVGFTPVSPVVRTKVEPTLTPAKLLIII